MCHNGLSPHFLIRVVLSRMIMPLSPMHINDFISMKLIQEEKHPFAIPSIHKWLYSISWGVNQIACNYKFLEPQMGITHSQHHKEGPTEDIPPDTVEEIQPNKFNLTAHKVLTHVYDCLVWLNQLTGKGLSWKSEPQK